jgi:hypothetical protein
MPKGTFLFFLLFPLVENQFLIVPLPFYFAPQSRGVGKQHTPKQQA